MSDKKASPQKIFSPLELRWLELELPEDSSNNDGKPTQSAEDKGKDIEKNKNALRDMLLTALQMPNLIVLAGSGTSLGEVGGPSMWHLWDHCVNQNAGESGKDRTKSEVAGKVIQRIEFNDGDDENIEALLSRCEAWLQIHPDDQEVKTFITESKKTILAKCTEFLNDDKLEPHRTFVRKLSGRHNRNPRLKIFTTNYYDLCFERAAALQGLIVIDGFSFIQPRRFDPLNFTYDIVRRPRSIEEHAAYLDGVFHLLKLHGSVNWERDSDNNAITQKGNPDAEKACLIYPARGKYQQSYVQPHLELVSQFFASLREPNTCVIVAGFGFNDDHLSEPMLAAIKSNPNLKFIVVDPNAEASAEGTKSSASRYWKELYELAKNDADVWLLNANFSQFVSRIPDLKALSRAQKLEQAVINTVKGSL
jgi:hypothetical protein